MLPDPLRIRELLEEALDSNRTPDEVCRENPELLLEVREQLGRVRSIEAQIEVLFASPGSKPDFGSGFSDDRHAELPPIPGYDMEALIGRGGMGVVYKARHKKLNRSIAIKMMLAGLYAGPGERKRFMREAEAMASLRHAHIVQVHDVGEFEGLPYFTMELVEGGNLAQKLAGMPQPARQAAELVATLAEAVQAAHGCGIIHRDLKPANILMTSDLTPKITDFAGWRGDLNGGPNPSPTTRRTGRYPELHGSRAGRRQCGCDRTCRSTSTPGERSCTKRSLEAPAVSVRGNFRGNRAAGHRPRGPCHLRV